MGVCVCGRIYYMERKGRGHWNTDERIDWFVLGNEVNLRAACRVYVR